MSLIWFLRRGNSTSFTKSSDNIALRKSFQIGFGRQLCNYVSIDSVSWILPHKSLALNIVHSFEWSKACNVQWLSYMRCVCWQNIKYSAMLFAPVCQCKRHMWFMSIKYDKVGLAFSDVHVKESDLPDNFGMLLSWTNQFRSFHLLLLGMCFPIDHHTTSLLKNVI